MEPNLQTCLRVYRLGKHILKGVVQFHGFGILASGTQELPSLLPDCGRYVTSRLLRQPWPPL